MGMKYTTVFMYIYECVAAAESEEIMKFYDFNDDLSSMIDMGILAPCVREAYRRKEKDGWIVRVANEHLRDGLETLSKLQISIIEDLIFLIISLLIPSFFRFSFNFSKIFLSLELRIRTNFVFKVLESSSVTAGVKFLPPASVTQ